MSLDTAISRLNLKVISGRPYSRMGYWRVGGPIEHLVSVESVEDIQTLYKITPTLSVLGAGSNMLVADEGVSGISIKLSGPLTGFEIVENGTVALVGGGMKNVRFLNQLKKLKLGGLGCIAGVPGTLGGAIRMNAGATLGEICDRVIKVEYIDLDGECKRTSREELQFAYRHCHGLPWGAIVSRVWLRISEAEFENEQASIEKLLARRKATQPLTLPSCGSTFTNPEGDYAGRLIDSVGLKGHRIGGAQISTLHANFIVNVENAKSMDIYNLMRLAKDRVMQETGISIEPEVKPMGDWPEGMWPLG